MNLNIVKVRELCRDTGMPIVDLEDVERLDKLITLNVAPPMRDVIAGCIYSVIDAAMFAKGGVAWKEGYDEGIIAGHDRGCEEGLILGRIEGLRKAVKLIEGESSNERGTSTETDGG